MIYETLPYRGMSLPEAVISALDGGVMVLWALDGVRGTRASVKAVYGKKFGPSITVMGTDAFDAMRTVIGQMGGRRN